MEILRVSPLAHEATGLFLSIAPDTAVLIAWPRSVFTGDGCPWQRVNWEYCGEQAIPIVRAVVKGAAYYYRAGDALYLALVTRQYHSQRKVLDAVCAELGMYIPDMFVDDNDLRLGMQRCGMSAPELQREDGVWLNVLEVLLHSDLDEARRALAFPDGTWDHKPVSMLEDWIHPLDQDLGANVATIVDAALVAAIERLERG